MKLTLDESLFNEGYGKFEWDILLKICKQYGVETLGDLERVCKENHIADPIQALVAHAEETGYDFERKDVEATEDLDPDTPYYDDNQLHPVFSNGNTTSDVVDDDDIPYYGNDDQLHPVVSGATATATEETTTPEELSRLLIYELRDNAGNLFDSFKELENARDCALENQFDKIYETEYSVGIDESVTPTGNEKIIPVRRRTI